jgi:hypothetical protein
MLVGLVGSIPSCSLRPRSISLVLSRALLTDWPFCEEVDIFYNALVVSLSVCGV